MEKIDFVILWVDGNDEKWINERSMYLYEKDMSTSTSQNRFRDWNILNYWFRGVEKYAPWVNKIYFVTYGHIPKWLNQNHEKLCIVKHTDFIPKKYLPTYNSNTIILNLHRIKSLSENFVLFNDDMFILDHVSKTDFFYNNMPKDFLSFNLISPTGNKNDSFNHMKINNINLINQYFTKKQIYQKNFLKLYSRKNGFSNNLKTFFLSPWTKITGFVDPHIPYSYQKSYFEKVWDKEYNLFDKTCSNRFRGNTDVTDWVIRYFQLCEGNFYPRSYKFGHYFEIDNQNIELCNHIRKQKSKIICINDVVEIENFTKVSLELSRTFDLIYPTKSSFEK